VPIVSYVDSFHFFLLFFHFLFVSIVYLQKRTETPVSVFSLLYSSCGSIQAFVQFGVMV
jgi:hypothetical protein